MKKQDKTRDKKALELKLARIRELTARDLGGVVGGWGVGCDTTDGCQTGTGCGCTCSVTNG